MSPAARSIEGCSSCASRASAARASAWVPVAIPSTRSRGSSRARSAGQVMSPGQSRYPVACATRACVCTLRPSMTMRRCVARAISPSIFKRWTFEANIATMTAPSALAAIARMASPTPRSLPAASPRASTLVESERSSATPWSPTARSRSTSNASPSMGSSSNLKSPVCTIVPACVRMTSAVASAIE